MNAWRPPDDPQLVLLLMAEFSNAGRHAEGAEFFAEQRRRYSGQLDGERLAWYLDAEAVLRADNASNISILRRVGYVRDTVALLDEAKRAAGANAFIARWMSGVVRAQLPGFLGERDAALEDLAWCEANSGRAPHPGWLRDVYFHLASLHRSRGEGEAAERYQTLSGVPAGTKSITYTTR